MNDRAFYQQSPFGFSSIDLSNQALMYHAQSQAQQLLRLQLIQQQQLRLQQL